MNAGPGGSPELRRALGFLLAIARDRSTEVVAVPGGEALLNRDFPATHSHNTLVVTRPCDPVALADAADAVLGGRGIAHRRIEVHDPALGARLADALAARGYEPSRELLMAATGPVAREASPRPPPDRPPRVPPRVPPGVPPRRSPRDVVELDLDERAADASAQWRREQPGWDDAVIDQLGRRIGTMLVAAQATFLAVRDRDGSVVARADVYLRDGVAQVEEVYTHPAHRGRGLASLLVVEGVRRARASGAELVFLIADADDWPQRLYRRLGFRDLGVTVSLTAGA